MTEPSFHYRMFDGGSSAPWPQFLPNPTPGEQLVRRLQNRIRYGGRKGRRAARRLAAMRERWIGDDE